MKQELTKFFQANPGLSQESPLFYHTYYRVSSYNYDPLHNHHQLTIISKHPNNQVKYKLEKTGNLHPDLINCLKEKEEIVYF